MNVNETIDGLKQYVFELQKENLALRRKLGKAQAQVDGYVVVWDGQVFGPFATRSEAEAEYDQLSADRRRDGYCGVELLRGPSDE